MAKTSTPGVPLRSLRGGALCFFWLLFAATGCADRPQPDAGSGTADSSGAPAASPVGIRVPLPRGWTARVEPGEVLAIGPAGRDVMRIRRSPENSMPSLESLKKDFTSNLAGLEARTVAEQSGEALVLWRFQLEATRGGGQGWPAALGARKVNDTVYLCATEPGATEAEVRDAARACAGLGQ